MGLIIKEKEVEMSEFRLECGFCGAREYRSLTIKIFHDPLEGQCGLDIRCERCGETEILVMDLNEPEKEAI